KQQGGDTRAAPTEEERSTLGGERGPRESKSAPAGNPPAPAGIESREHARQTSQSAGYAKQRPGFSLWPTRDPGSPISPPDCESGRRSGSAPNLCRSLTSA